MNRIDIILNDNKEHILKINNSDYIGIYKNSNGLPYIQYFKNSIKVATNYYSNKEVCKNHLNKILSNVDRIRVINNTIVIVDDNYTQRENYKKELSKIFTDVDNIIVILKNNKLKYFTVKLNGIEKKIYKGLDYSNIIGIFTKTTNNKDLLYIYNKCIENKEKINNLLS